MKEIYDILKIKANDLFQKKNMLSWAITVKAKVLTPEEAIGNPDDKDFPIQKGRERLMQATLFDSQGQAFTDQFGDFAGTMDQILNMRLNNNYRRAIFIAALNAGLRHLGLINGTVHCKDNGPSQCAKELAVHIGKNYGNIRIVQIGFQPRMLEVLSSVYELRILDLDVENIGRKKFGLLVEGPEKTREAVDWADMLLVTGTTIVNGTASHFIGTKPVLFYGTSIAGAAYLMGWDRFCAKSS